MSDGVTETRSRAGADERSGSNAIAEQPQASSSTPGSDESRKLKRDQKRRLENTDRETLIQLFRQMLLVRRFEEKAAESYSLGKIGGFCHLYIGQEAVAIGCISVLRTDDYVLTSYREHAHAIAKGISPEAVMAELFGKAGGCSRGKGGSMHICDNNQYGMGTSQERAMSLQDIAQKACAYEIASEFVDGMDVLAVREATLRAVERARKDYLPTLLEVRTYRFMGHSMSDPGNYRTRAEIERYQERDPIKLFAASLKEQGVLSDTEFQQVE